jgi:hypothetical protein
MTGNLVLSPLESLALQAHLTIVYAALNQIDECPVRADPREPQNE